jgi:hypothetical protein
MPDDEQELNPLLRFHPWPIGDYFVLPEAVLQELEASKQAEIAGMYLDSLSATLQAKVKYVEGVRNVLSSGAKQR